MLFRLCRRRVLAVLTFALGAVAVVRAEVPVISITIPPFVAPDEAADRSAGAAELNLTAAQQALELGFHTAARQLFADALKHATNPALRSRAALGLASVEIAAERPDEAEAALAQFMGLGSPRVNLRRAMIALLRKNTVDAARQLDGISTDEMPADEVAWVFVAQGWMYHLQAIAAQQRADEALRRGQAAEVQRPRAEADALRQKGIAAFAQAETRLRSEQARAQVQLTNSRVNLVKSPPTPEALRAQRRQMEQFQGVDLGLQAAETLAGMLDTLGRKEEARSLLQEQLQLATDQWPSADAARLTLAMIMGSNTPSGTNELRRLLKQARSPEMRRKALELLANTAVDRETQERLRAELDGRIADQPASPILEDLLLYRARLALELKDFSRTEEDVGRLLSQFPGSPLRAPAQFLLVASAWEQQRYRTAADAVARLREEADLPVGDRGSLTVLQAEASFRAEDYRSAATAYGAALAGGNLPTAATRGGLMFQQVLALMRAEQAEETPSAAQFTETTALLDRLAGDATFDAVSRWQAEWNFAKSLQVRGLSRAAYERVGRVVDGAGAGAVPAELLLRMTWLQAKLSLEAGETAATLRHVERLLAGPAAAGNSAVEARLREQVAGAAGLLRVQALLESKPPQVEPAKTELARLRKQFPGSDSAIYSYIVMAGYYASIGRPVDAQVELQALVDRHGDSEYAPFALYQLAMSEKQRGYDHLDDAYLLLESLVKKYPRDALVFYARMRQGDFLREMHRFGEAQGIYESLEREFPSHPDRPLVEIALAHTLYGLWSSDPTMLDRALQRFERLYDSPSASIEVRIEAGYMLGFGMARRGGTPEARTEARAQACATWFKLFSRYLFDEKLAARVEERGRLWLAKALAEYARVCEEDRKPEQARLAYELIVRHGLTGEHTARARLGLAEPARPGS